MGRIKLLGTAVLLAACGSVNAPNSPDGTVSDTVADTTTDAPPPTDLGAFAQAGTFPHARAGHASVVHSGRLWIIGGNVCQACLADVVHDNGGTTGNVVSAPIDAAGAIGTFREDGNLVVVRTTAQAFAATRGGHDYLYVIGGVNSTGASNTDVFPTTVERAEITSAGLTAFTTVSNLNVGRSAPQLIVRGDDVYVLGGSTGGANGFSTSIEHAVLDATGGLGPFSIDTATLAIPSAFHAIVEDGDTVLLLGGVTQNSITIADLQQATFTGTSLGSFSAVAASTSKLRAPRAVGAAIVLEHRAFVLGGGDGNLVKAFDDEETAALAPLGGFVAGAVTLDQARSNATSHRIANRFCVIGGVTTGTLDPTKYLGSIVCAPLI